MRTYLYDGISQQNQRNTNMDRLLLKKRTIAGQDVFLAVVCDGVGSMENGAVASSNAVQMLRAWMDDLEDTARLGLRLRDYVLEVNRQIVVQAREMGIRTATTLSALLLTEDQYYVVHAGDSRIYSFENEQLVQLTVDQVASGKLTTCIGYTEHMTLYYNEGIQQGKRFLLCSDGLYKRMNIDYLKQELAGVNGRTIKKVLERLTQYVIAQGETDNISVAIVL